MLTFVGTQYKEVTNQIIWVNPTTQHRKQAIVDPRTVAGEEVDEEVAVVDRVVEVVEVEEAVDAVEERAVTRVEVDEETTTATATSTATATAMAVPIIRTRKRIIKRLLRKIETETTITSSNMHHHRVVLH